MAEINENTEYGGGDILNRFAISALSKKYNEQALAKEFIWAVILPLNEEINSLVLLEKLSLEVPVQEELIPLTIVL